MNMVNSWKAFFLLNENDDSIKNANKTENGKNFPPVSQPRNITYVYILLDFYEYVIL